MEYKCQTRDHSGLDGEQSAVRTQVSAPVWISDFTLSEAPALIRSSFTSP